MQKLTLRDLILIALFAAIGIAAKPVVSPVANLLTDPLRITGGSAAGGIYMAVLVLARLLVPKRGSAALTGLLEGFLALFSGVTSFQGLLAIAIYTLPGIAVEIVFALFSPSCFAACAACVAANMTGASLTNALFFRLRPRRLCCTCCWGLAARFAEAGLPFASMRGCGPSWAAKAIGRGGGKDNEKTAASVGAIADGGNCYRGGR